MRPERWSAMKVILSMLAMVLLLQTGAAGQSVVDPKFLIVPGKSVGELEVGMTIDEIRAILGDEVSTAVSADKQITLYRFGTPQTFNVYVMSGRVSGIYTFLPEYKTAEGIGVGSALDELIAAYGTPDTKKEGKAAVNGNVYDVWFVGYGNHLQAVVDRKTEKVIAFGT